MDENNIKTEPLASEMYEDLKKATRFREKIIYILLIVVGVLVIALAATNIYHILQLSKFETVVVESTEGPKTYVEGETTGGILNGTGYSSPETGRTVQGDQS